MPTPQEIEAESLSRQSKGVVEWTPEQKAQWDSICARLPKPDFSAGAFQRQAAAVTADALGANDEDILYPWNPAHPIGTCAKCGKEMVYNCPRLGPNAGYVHMTTGEVLCPPAP